MHFWVRLIAVTNGVVNPLLLGFGLTQMNSQMNFLALLLLFLWVVSSMMVIVLWILWEDTAPRDVEPSSYDDSPWF